MVGPDPPEAFRRLWRTMRLPFPGIPDPGGGLLRLLGQEVYRYGFGRMPSCLAVASDGTVVYRHRGRSPWDLAPWDKLVAELMAYEAARQPPPPADRLPDTLA